MTVTHQTHDVEATQKRYWSSGDDGIEVFFSLKHARQFRLLHNTNGWILEYRNTGAAMLFPPEMTPDAIKKHEMVKSALKSGLTCRLIGPDKEDGLPTGIIPINLADLPTTDSKDKTPK